MLDKDIEHCLAVLKEECINERQSLFDYKLISTLEKCKGLESENKALKEAMQEFVDKVDRGQARSVKTYARFKELLDD